jgi:hypothetical protein
MGSVWSNTADNIISGSVVTTGNNIGVGSRLIILKSNNFTNGTPTGVIKTPYIQGSWVRVGSQVLSTTASSITFSGLNGDNDVIYYIASQAKWSGATGAMELRINGDTGTNYGDQVLRAVDTTVTAARSTSNDGVYLGQGSYGDNAYGNHFCILFAEKGYVRPLLSYSTDGISGTTVSALNCIGSSWANTTSTISSLTVYASANYMAAGTQVDVYALRPNG